MPTYDKKVQICNLSGWDDDNDDNDDNEPWQMLQFYSHQQIQNAFFL